MMFKIKNLNLKLANFESVTAGAMWSFYKKDKHSFSCGSTFMLKTTSGSLAVFLTVNFLLVLLNCRADRFDVITGELLDRGRAGGLKLRHDDSVQRPDEEETERVAAG